MLRVVVVAGSFAALLTACPAPTPPPPPGGGNNTCDVDGATLPKPDALAKRSDAAPIDRSCVGTPAHFTSANTTATLQGCIKIFGIGNIVKSGITVSVFDSTQDPKKDTAAHGSVVISQQADAAGLDCAGADKNTAACISLTCDSQGAYSLDNVPLHVPLIVKVSLAGDAEVIDSYAFDEIFDGPNEAEPDTNGFVDYPANVIFSSTYQSIPTLGGQLIDGGSVIDGVGRGVIAGEVRDCADTPVQGATIVSDQMDSKTKVTFFNGDTNDEQPDVTQTATNSDGLYTILNANTDPGKNTHVVSAAILDPTCAATDSCQCVSMSTRTARVFPDSVSIVTFRGDLPTP